MSKDDIGESSSNNVTEECIANDEKSEKVGMVDLSGMRFGEMSEDSYDAPIVTSEDEHTEQVDKSVDSSESSSTYSLIKKMLVVNPIVTENAKTKDSMKSNKNVHMINEIVEEELNIEDLRSDPEENSPPEDLNEPSSDDVGDLLHKQFVSSFATKNTKDGMVGLRTKQQELTEEMTEEVVDKECTAEKLLNHDKKEIVENDTLAKVLTAQELVKQVKTEKINSQPQALGVPSLDPCLKEMLKANKEPEILCVACLEKLCTGARPKEPRTPSCRHCKLKT